jgi:hypothetical protein
MTAKRLPATVICGAALYVLLAASGVSGAPPDSATCFGDPATIVGTPGNDRIRGTNEIDVIVARGGNDVVGVAASRTRSVAVRVTTRFVAEPRATS